ncbi:hypothetical protein A3759_17065 [Thalassolituus sp. HI0120]|nr:hypothetical protein A3759_17065 [Thalassolituus sp. HI0120]
MFLKYLLLGLIFGLIATAIFSLMTAKVDGFNVMTGESMSYTGWKAIYADISDKGPKSYLTSLLPAYVLLASSTTVAFYILGNYWNRSV